MSSSSISSSASSLKGKYNRTNQKQNMVNLQWRIQTSRGRGGRGRGGRGGGGHPDPGIKGGGGGLEKKFFSALWASVWSKNKGGFSPGSPTDLFQYTDTGTFYTH